MEKLKRVEIYLISCTILNSNCSNRSSG